MKRPRSDSSDEASSSEEDMWTPGVLLAMHKPPGGIMCSASVCFGSAGTPEALVLRELRKFWEALILRELRTDRPRGKTSPQMSRRYSRTNAKPQTKQTTTKNKICGTNIKKT